MVNLTKEEEHWLRVFAEENEEFESMLTSYEVNRYLSSKQRHRIRTEISKEENDGDVQLKKEELIFLKEFVDIDSDLAELLEIYEIYGCFSEYEYHKFTKLKFKYIENEKEKHYNYKDIKRNKLKAIKEVLTAKNQYKLNNDPIRLTLGSDNSDGRSWEDLVKLWERLDEEDKKSRRK